MVNIGGIEGPAGPVNAIPLSESVCNPGQAPTLVRAKITSYIV